jgi:PIN domain
VTGLTLDAGALVAHEREEREVVARLRRAAAIGIPMYVPAGVLGQVWRDGRRQARLAHLLTSRHVHVVSLDMAEARAAGQLCGAAGTSDVIDASVVVCAALRATAIVTSDPDDLRRLDPSITLILV